MNIRKQKIKNLLKGLSRHKENNYYYSVEVLEREKRYGSNFESYKRMDDLMFLLYSQLNEEEKLLVDLQFREKLSVNDISEKLYISPSTFQRRMDKIYNKLIKYMKNFQELFFD